jgi:hypothetical protein
MAVPQINDGCVMRYGYHDTTINALVNVEQGQEFTFREIGAFREFCEFFRTHQVAGIKVPVIGKVCLGNDAIVGVK